MTPTLHKSTDLSQACSPVRTSGAKIYTYKYIEQRKTNERMDEQHTGEEITNKNKNKENRDKRNGNGYKGSKVPA